MAITKSEAKATLRKPPRPAKVEAEPFNRLVSHARLQGLRLTGTKFEIKPQALTEDRNRWAYRISDALLDWQLDCDEGLLRGQYSYNAACVEGRRKPVALNATYLATYRLSQDCDEDAALAYLRRIGRFSCYPYFRALFGILTEQSGLQLPPLPVIVEQPRLVKAD